VKLSEGQVAVVTGAASGIGLGLCKALAERGLRLVLADVDAARLDAAAAEIQAADAPLAQRCDVAKADDVRALADAALRRFGRIDLAFNNAGVVLPFKPMWEHGAEDWDWLLGINLWGVIHGIRTFVPLMVEQDSGHIVNTASMAGMTVLPFNGVYNASKHAVVSLTETLAEELRQRAPGVRASVVCPGLVPTAAASRGGAAGMSRASVAPGAEKNTISLAEAVTGIIAGVERDDVYIFTNPGSRQRIEARFAGILAAL